MSRYARHLAALLGLVALPNVTSRPSSDSLLLAALLNDGSNLVILDGVSGSALVTYNFGTVKQFGFGPGLAYDSATASVLFPVVDSNSTTRVMSVNLRDRSLRTVAVVSDSVGYPWLDVGLKTGRLYLMAGDGIRAVVLDRASERVLTRITIARDTAYNWKVFRARVAPNESRIYLTYHGGCSPRQLGPHGKCAGGIDWVDLAPEPSLCSRDSTISPSNGCIRAHGDFKFLGDRLVATTGDGMAEIDWTGKSLRWLDPKLMTHLMTLDVDPVRKIAFAAVSCAYGHGISALPLADSVPVPSFTPELWRSTCGDGVVLSTDGAVLIVVNSPDGLDAIDAHTGKLIRHVAVDGHVLDLVAVARGS